jgi:addiction module HigA family antidote
MRTPIHPGEILKEEMDCLNISANKLASMLHIPTNRITQILNGKRAITPDTARRLSAFFKTSPAFWMNLQLIYDMDVDFSDKQKENDISLIKPYTEYYSLNNTADIHSN